MLFREKKTNSTTQLRALYNSEHRNWIFLKAIDIYPYSFLISQVETYKYLFLILIA